MRPAVSTLQMQAFLKGIAGGTRSDAMRSRSLSTYHRCVVQLNDAEGKSHRDDQPPSR